MKKHLALPRKIHKNIKILNQYDVSGDNYIVKHQTKVKTHSLVVDYLIHVSGVLGR